MLITCPQCGNEITTPAGYIERKKKERGVVYCPVCNKQLFDFRAKVTVSND